MNERSPKSQPIAILHSEACGFPANVGLIKSTEPSRPRAPDMRRNRVDNEAESRSSLCCRGRVENLADAWPVLLNTRTEVSEFVSSGNRHFMFEIPPRANAFLKPFHHQAAPSGCVMLRVMAKPSVRSDQQGEESG